MLLVLVLALRSAPCCNPGPCLEHVVQDWAGRRTADGDGRRRLHLLLPRPPGSDPCSCGCNVLWHQAATIIAAYSADARLAPLLLLLRDPPRCNPGTGSQYICRHLCC